MATVKKHDFVEIEYTGRIKEDGAIFDTTQEKVAKENGLYDKNADYSPALICVGENNILKGLEEQIIGKEIGKEYTFEVSSDNAFGRKDAKLIQLIPTSKFRQQNIQPIPGLQLNIDGVFGIVKTVSGGRVLVDFNHPLSGKDLIYNVKINRIVDDDKEKLNSLLKMHLHIKNAEIEVKEESNASELPTIGMASESRQMSEREPSSRIRHEPRMPLRNERERASGEMRVSEELAHKSVARNSGSQTSRSEARSQLSVDIKLKQKIPKEAQEEFKNIVQRTIPSIKNTSFTSSEDKNK